MASVPRLVRVVGGERERSIRLRETPSHLNRVHKLPPTDTEFTYVTKLRASRPRKFTPDYGATRRQQYDAVSFAAQRVLMCLHLPGLYFSCCNGVHFCYDLEIC